MSLSWKPAGYGSAKAYDTFGRVVGEYDYRCAKHEWEAWVEGNHLGRFITEEYAKTAVERAAMKDKGHDN